MKPIVIPRGKTLDIEPKEVVPASWSKLSRDPRVAKARAKILLETPASPEAEDLKSKLFLTPEYLAELAKEYIPPTLRVSTAPAPTAPTMTAEGAYVSPEGMKYPYEYRGVPITAERAEELEKYLEEWQKEPGMYARMAGIRPLEEQVRVAGVQGADWPSVEAQLAEIEIDQAERDRLYNDWLEGYRESLKGVTPEEKEWLATPYEQLESQRYLEQAWGAELEGYISEITAYMEESPEGFIDTVREIGRNEETVALLKTLGATESEVGEIFGAPVVPPYGEVKVFPERVGIEAKTVLEELPWWQRIGVQFLQKITELPWFPAEVKALQGLDWASEKLKEYYARPLVAMATLPFVALADPNDPGAQKYKQILTELASEAGQKYGESPATFFNVWWNLNLESLPGGGVREAYEDWQAPAGLRGGLEIAAEIPLWLLMGQAFRGGKKPVVAEAPKPIAKWADFIKTDIYKRIRGANLSAKVEQEAFRAYEFYIQGNKDMASKILGQIYQAFPGAAPPEYLRTTALVPYYPEMVGLRKPPVVAPKPAPVKPPTPVTGKPPAVVKPLVTKPVVPVKPVTPEVTGKSWNAMPAYQQAELAKSVGLTPRSGTVYWKELTPSERDVLSKAKVPEVAIPKAEIPLAKVTIKEVGTYTEQEIYQMEQELAGLKEWLSTEPTSKLISLIKKTGWMKGELSNLTLNQYRTITQKTPSPNILTSDKKHVRWEYALDDIATEMGYESGDALRYAIEQAGEATTRIKALGAELARAEVIRPGIIEVTAPKVSIIQQMQTLRSELDTEVKAMQAAIKELTADEAKVAREVLEGLERELKYVKNTLESFVKRPDLPEATVLRSTIMAWARIKGLPKTQLQEIFSSVAGRRQLRVIPQEQLVTILDKVKEARPKRIAGKEVITPKTEKKIQTLKDTLIANKQLTEKSFNHLVEQLGLRATGYQSATKFITESEGKALIRAMNDEAVLAEWDIKVEESLARHPDIKEARDGLNARSVKEREVTFDEKPIKIKRGNELRSMRYYVLKLQKELNAPIYDVWQKINMTHLTMRHKQQQLYNKLEQSTPEFKIITGDETALRRVEDFIASKHKMGPKAPLDITAEEVKLAEELERQLFDFRNDVRYARFSEAYAGHSGELEMMARDIPDAPKRALRRAADIFEGKGAEALRKFLDTQDWGVIRTGYDPRSIVKPRLYLYPAKPTTFAKGHIQTREGTEYTQEDRTILQRYRSYTKQMTGLTDLAPLIRAFDRVFTEHAHKLEDPRHVASVLSRGINEMKGYREDGGLFVHIIERLYAQVAATVFWRPDLVLRNKFQNWAFNPDFHLGLFMHPKNRFMSKERRAWFELFVTQNRGIIQDVMFQEMKPIRGFGRLTRLANRTSLFPWSDHSNRAECFFVRMNRVDRALAQYEKDGNLKKLINNSGLLDFESRQQAEALELLAMDSVDYGVEGMPAVTGKEAFARYNGQQLTNNVHFLYDRSQRAPAEMGATGKVLGNIFVFQRSWAERFLNQGRKLIDPKVGAREKRLALRIVVGVIVCGMLAGEAYKKITGKKYNPYNPLNILTYGPGGLMLGITEDLSNVMYLITEAVQGSKAALGSLPGVLSGVADLTLPFYKNICQALEAITDMKNIDAWALRKIREMIDDEYEVRGGTHEVERTLLEKLQHALLAGVTEPPTPQEKVADAEEMLGSTIEEEDKPFSIEDPDIYDMRKLNTDLGQILRDIPVEDITEKNGYSTLAIAWLAKEASEAVWQSSPSMPLYKINADPNEGDTFEEYYRQWQERKGIKEPKKLKEFDDLYPRAHLGNISRRQYDLLKQYHSLEKPEQVEFLEKHPELKLNPRNEWLKANPIDNARLAVWGEAKILTQEAYDEVIRLIKELDIPDDGIPEFTLPPEGSVENYFDYLKAGEELGYNSWEVQLIIAQDEDLREFLERQPIETPVRSLELKVKHRELFDQYDALGDKDSPLYIEDDEARDEARDNLKADNPEWVDDMRRIEAIEHGAADDLIEGWVERGKLVDEFSAGSSEVKVWLFDHPETFEWALEQELLTDDGSDWNVPVLRINAKWRAEDDEYEALETTEDRVAYLTEHENYRKDRRRRDAYGLKGPIGEKFPEDQIENYVAYYELEAKGFRQERYLIDNPGFGQAMHEIAGIDLPDRKKIPAVGYDETYEKHKESFDKLRGLADHKSEHYIEDPDKRAAERYKMRYDARGNPTDFYKAEKRLDAYAFFVPEDLVDTFVEWYVTKPQKSDDPWFSDHPGETYYGDDWFLMEHPRFYQTMLDLKIWLEEPRDFSKVPTKEVFALYKTYQGLPQGTPRFDFRAKHPDLDAWGVIAKDWEPIGQRGKKETPKTPWEKFEEIERFKELF